MTGFHLSKTGKTPVAGRINSLRQEYARCVAVRMQKNRCRLRNLPAGSLIIDLDRGGAPGYPSAQRCDYLLFAAREGRGKILFCPAEMKGTAASEVLSQLQAGATIGAKMLAICRKEIEFFPICVYRRRIHSDIMRIFRNGTVTFRCQNTKIKKRVRLIKSGSDLQQKLARE